MGGEPGNPKGSSDASCLPVSLGAKTGPPAAWPELQRHGINHGKARPHAAFSALTHSHPRPPTIPDLAMDSLVAQYTRPAFTEEGPTHEEQLELCQAAPELSLKFALPPVAQVWPLWNALFAERPCAAC